MEQTVMINALVQQKRAYQYLNDVMEISRQLSEAADREDPIQVQMFVAMRAEPVEKLKAVKTAIEQQVAEAHGTEEGSKLDSILYKGFAGETAEEQMLAAQVEVNRRLHAQVMQLDRSISFKLIREKSIYHQ